MLTRFVPALGLGPALSAAPAPAQTMRDNVALNLLGAQDLTGSLVPLASCRGRKGSAWHDDWKHARDTGLCQCYCIFDAAFSRFSSP